MNSPIVITGMGMISPLGCGVKPVWQRLTAAQSGIRLIDRFDTAEIPIKIAGLVPGIEDDSIAGFDVDQIIEKKERKKLCNKQTGFPKRRTTSKQRQPLLLPALAV